MKVNNFGYNADRGVEVGIAHIHREQGADGADFLHRSHLDGNALLAELAADLREGGAGDEAEVDGAGRGMLRLGLELLAVLVQVQLLTAEAQPRAAGAEGDDLESQDALVEVAGAGEVAHREYHVI